MEDIASQISVIFSIQHDWRDQISCFPRYCRDTCKGRWNNKSPFNSILTQQHLGKKLQNPVNLRWSYSVLHQCRFFDTQCRLSKSVKQLLRSSDLSCFQHGGGLPSSIRGAYFWITHIKHLVVCMIVQTLVVIAAPVLTVWKLEHFVHLAKLRSQNGVFGACDPKMVWNINAKPNGTVLHGNTLHDV